MSLSFATSSGEPIADTAEPITIIKTKSVSNSKNVEEKGVKRRI